MNLSAQNFADSNQPTPVQLRPATAIEGASIYVGGVDFTPRAIVVDNDDNTYVTGDDVIQKQDGSTDTNVGLYKVSPQFKQVLSVSIGGTGYDSVRAMALDDNGNIYLTGLTQSADFPVDNPVQSSLNGAADAFLTKINPQGNIVFSTYFGGSGSEVGEVLTESYGTAFVGGRTGSTDFPVTPNAFQSEVVAPTEANGLTTKFAFKIDTSLKLVFSTTLGGSLSGPEGFAGIAPAPYGEVYFLQTPGAASPGTVAGGGSGLPTQSLIRLSADGSKLTFSIDIGAVGGDAFSAMTTQQNGNLVLAGTGELLRWDIIGNQEIGREKDNIGWSPTVAVDYLGNAVVHGTGAKGHPITFFGFTVGNEFVTKFRGIGPEVYFGGAMPNGTADVAVAVGPYGNIHTLGSSGLVSRLAPKIQALTLPRILGVASSAGQMTSSSVAPGEIISLYGPQIGGPDATGPQVSADGQVMTDLAGIQVQFNGTAGSMLYAGPTQINVVAPFDLGSSDSVLVEVLHDGKTWATTNLHRVKAAPDVFPSAGTTAAAALNEDGAVNSQADRAVPGSVVTVFVTGAGDMKSASYRDGEVFDAKTPIKDLPSPKLPISVSYQGTPLQVLYFGQAPGELAGVVQLNFRLPEATSPPASDVPLLFKLKVGDVSADPFGIWVKRR